ncbi:serine/threonine-protein kinase [Demequina zhanjiangensis]|uniref:non-specific serine/threonine protein kinase n=1 Tax=Demequina zhanjiangensis TaxID=3051659 RepID=A0ABT8FXG3_9MICO|nr:serine/threonine-protein kinase [Demequina sp. SYSU T00b26]MDN4471492.1 serine/threonine-protein kinase [Demequina sp. SYSU T00b26]
MPRRSTAPPPVLPGYSYIRPLGAGGFADVFLYEQDMPRRVVAVKVLLDDAINPDVLRAFTGEADTLARLSAHPAIVTIHQASISADGRPYFVMEYCPDTLAAEAKREPLPAARALDAAVRVASALETAHRSGVLHRDIKPSNLLVTTLDTPVLADFGIASAIAAADDATDTIAMSLPWSAPEVVRGDTNGTVASEIWSLGATLYTLVAGHAPFEPADGERIGRRKHEELILKGRHVPTGREDLGDRFAAALERCLQKDPAARFGSMMELAEELRWAQYDLALAPTAIEVATPEWAAATGSAPAEPARLPTISTVQTQSRRAARAQHLASTQRRKEQSTPDAPPRRVDRRTLLIGAAIGAAVVALGSILLAAV